MTLVGFLCVSFVSVVHILLETADAKICMLSGTRTFSVDRAMVIGRDQQTHRTGCFWIQCGTKTECSGCAIL
ncbi:uncharacterized protein BKA55DRAFT_552520 [Fusarium redolens]|uniref:Secreted protein n=1 Tax=Fusarium redolens TaxID=48865 RepID=A0A9P9KY36_FUSRE|nr:uncharacterized protein BKA55DRAFT_552520 [Fusarium redolens]KAH7270718.1 hypothetical protein BKA55DRAFT_552520 [Fusarium redolens]